MKEKGMLALPQTAHFGKVIPKKKFYEHGSVTPAMKRLFIDGVEQIRWSYKIAPSTMNIAEGKNVIEIEILELTLKNVINPEGLLKVIDQAIPYHILFLLHWEGKVQAWIAYKSVMHQSIQVKQYFHTDWMTMDDLPLQLEGLSTDKLYENWIRQMAGGELAKDTDHSLEKSIAIQKERQQLQKEIEKLRKKIRKEKQYNRQVELREQYIAMQKTLEAL